MCKDRGEERERRNKKRVPLISCQRQVENELMTNGRAAAASEEGMNNKKKRKKPFVRSARSDVCV